MSDQGVRDRTPNKGRRRLARRSLIAGLTVFLMLAGVGVSYAAWTSTANSVSSASAASLTVTTGGFNSNAFTFQNHLLTTTGYVTATNTTDTPSITPGTLELSFSYTGSAALAAGLTVKVWPIVSTSSCTPAATAPGGAVSGRWDTVATTSSPITATLAKNATQNYCVRVTAADRGDIASASGSITLQPSVSATLKVGNWKKTATASTTTQQTVWIFPAFGPTPNTWYQIKNLGTSNCVDVFGANDPNGTGIIDYACKTDTGSGSYNQHWKFTRSTGDYYDATPRHAPGTRMDIVGQSTLASAAVDIQNASTHLSQEWQLQARSANVYQIVNRNSGMCLKPLNTTTYDPEIEYAQVVCGGSADQTYSLTWIAVDLPPMTLACAASSGGGVTLSWAGAAIDTYNFQAKPNSGGSYGNIGSPVTAGATSFTALPAAISGADGQYNVQALWLTNQLATSNLWKITTAGTSALSCTPPIPVLNAVTCSSSPNNSVAISWGHAAQSTYTIQLFSNGNWINLGTAAAGSTSYTVAGGLYWVTGVRDLRVVSGAQSVQFQVYNSNGSQNSSTLWCWPAQPVTSVTCTHESSGDYLTLSWPRTSAGTSLVRMTIPGISSFTRNVTYSGSTASVQFLDDDVRNATAGNSIPATFQLEADGAVVGLLPDRNVRITGTGTGQNSKNLFCQ